MTRIQVILSFIGIIVLMGIVGHFDYEDEQNNNAHYCHMRALYESDAALGFTKHNRTGWPAFKPELESYCASLPISKD
jgi:hypothetical protein